MKYAEANQLALALHACAHLIVDEPSAELFAALLKEVGKYIESTPTMFTSKRLADIAINGQSTAKPMSPELLAKIKAGGQHGLGKSAAKAARTPEQVAEDKAKMAALRAKRGTKAPKVKAQVVQSSGNADADADAIAAVLASLGIGPKA